VSHQRDPWIPTGGPSRRSSVELLVRPAASSLRRAEPKLKLSFLLAQRAVTLQAVDHEEERRRVRATFGLASRQLRGDFPRSPLRCAVSISLTSFGIASRTRGMTWRAANRPGSRRARKLRRGCCAASDVTDDAITPSPLLRAADHEHVGAALGRKVTWSGLDRDGVTEPRAGRL
jgi:hypothetical protein